MKAEIAVINDRDDLATYSLDELAAMARAENAEAEQHLVGALKHYVRLGEVLLAARARLKDEKVAFAAWLESVGLGGRSSPYQAMRLAHYADHLPRSAFEPHITSRGSVKDPSITSALVYLRGLPDLAFNRHRDEVRDEALRLRSSGMPLAAVGKILDISPTTVHGWCDPKKKRAYDKRSTQYKRTVRAQKRALKDQQERAERAELVRAVPGDFSKVYGHIRQALSILDRITAGDNPATVAFARKAISQCHSAENTIVEALQHERGST